MTKARLQMTALHAWIERQFPCSFDRGGPILVSIGVMSALVYVYTRIGFKHEMRDLPQNLMVLTFFVSAWGQRHRLKTDMMFGLLVLAILIPWLLFGINALIDYESAVEYRSLNDLVKLMLFLPLAWWLGGSRAAATKMLTLAFLGLMTAVALDPDLPVTLQRLWAGTRIDFAIHNAQHGAMFFGLVIIYCACKVSRRIRTEAVANPINALLVTAGLLGVVGLVGTQTRAAFLGLFACGFVAAIQVVRQKSLFGRSRWSAAQGILVLIVVATLLGWFAKELLHNRLQTAAPDIEALLDGRVDQVGFSSVGLRIHFWAESLGWLAERPVTGWGLKAREDVIRLGERFPDAIKAEGFGHIHNGYLELVLGFGAVGVVFVVILWTVLLWRIRLAASQELYAFALYSSVFFLVLNMFESFFFYWSGEFAVALFMAGGYSQYLAHRLGDDRPD